MKIRRAVAEDIEAINKLLCQVLEVHHKGRPDIFKGGAKKYTDSELLEIIADDTRPIFVCEEEEIQKLVYDVFLITFLEGIIAKSLTDFGIYTV